MTKSVRLSIIFVLAFNFCFTQTLPLPTLLPGWERIYIKNVGSFDLPPTMEVQQGKYREFTDEFKKIVGFDASEIIAQQKGLNVLGKDGLAKYARVMVKTIFGYPGEFEKLNFNVSELTQIEINEIDEFLAQQIQKNLRGIGGKLTEWYPLKIETVNGMSCIHISYLRKIHENPEVLVHTYHFHNNDRMHTLTLSYRLSESDYWKTDFTTILKSFRISNIR
jgi:hypothetical protein